MTIDLLPWHWVVFGIVLVMAEIFLATFFILWFGVAAIVVGAVLYVVPTLSMTIQVLVWSILSSILAIAWFKYLKPLSRDRTKAGLSKEAITGEIGQVLVAPSGDKRGRLRFPAPVLGDDEWVIISQDDLIVGDKVSVVDVSGNSLIVKKFVSTSNGS